jgi:hypothetical protein
VLRQPAGLVPRPPSLVAAPAPTFSGLLGTLADSSGLTGSIGAIHANRLSTLLPTNLHPASLHPKPSSSPPHGFSPIQAPTTLYVLAFPCQAAFLLFVRWTGWIDLSLGWAGWLTFAVTVSLAGMRVIAGPFRLATSPVAVAGEGVVTVTVTLVAAVTIVGLRSVLTRRRPPYR